MTCILFNFSFAFAQTEEDVIKQIRQQFKTINDEIKTYTTKSDVSILEGSGAEQTITAYFKGKQLMKTEEQFMGDMAENTYHYYYWDNELFFVFNKYTYYAYIDGEDKAIINENRYYFDKNKMIRWIDSEKKQVSKSSDDFKQKEKENIAKAKKFINDYGKL
jgi:hypothetical protein